MNKIDSKNKKFMIFGIIILVIAVVSSTLAYYIWSSGEQIKISTTVGGAYVYFDGGSAIENATLRPVADKSKGITKNISMRADATGVTANVYLDLVTLPNSLKDVSFRYAIYNGSTLAKEGNFSSTSLSSSTSTCTANSTTHITLLSNVSVPITKTTYTLYIWIDGANYTNPKSMMNQTFSFKLHADGTGAILNNEYELTNSDGNTYTPTYNGSGTKTIRSSAPLSKFKEVKVDDVTVDSSNYTLTEGSTIVTFKEAYLQSLSVGDHTFKIISTDGIASGKITIKKTVTAAQMITNLYNNSDKTAVTNNSITYNYATSVNLMNDRKGSMSTGIDSGNIRYYGASPNNYIYFNCSDYANQSSSTCEMWRIIGVFDGKVKLIRDSHIGSYSWDNKNISTGAETDEGKNDWTDARLMKLLNPGYESETIGGSLYYDAKSGNCYSGKSNATKACDFTTIGIKNAATRNIISDTTYYLGGYDVDSGAGFSEFSNNAYTYERGKAVFTGRPTEWTGKVGLAYPSDYGYAADFSKCQQQLANYHNTSCTANNWMNNIITSNGEGIGAFISPNAKNQSQILIATVHSAFNYSVFSIATYFIYNVIPVLYLDPSVDIKLGFGTSTDPYQLNV